MKLSVSIVAVLLSVAPMRVSSNENHLIGPLFFTPEQRDLIDLTGAGHEAANGDAPVRVAPGSIRFNGSVRRSHGRTTAWVSGVRLEKIAPTDDLIDIELAGDKLVVERRAGNRILKAGESLAPEDGNPSSEKTTDSAR